MNPFKIKYREHPFEVGEKVLFVSGQVKGPERFTPPLELHKIYVIREALFTGDDGEPTVTLVGVFGPPNWHGGENPLRAWHFISLQEYRANAAARAAARRGLHLEFQPEPSAPKKPSRGRGKRQPGSSHNPTNPA